MRCRWELIWRHKDRKTQSGCFIEGVESNWVTLTSLRAGRWRGKRRNDRAVKDNGDEGWEGPKVTELNEKIGKD